MSNSAMQNMKQSGNDNEKKIVQKDELDIPERALMHTVEVEGIGPVNTLIDSGYGACLISLDLLTDSMKAYVEPIAAGNAGRANLHVSYLGKTVELPFLVVNKMNFPMLLGSNWICKSRATLQSDGAHLKVSFKRKWYSELLAIKEADKKCLPAEVVVELEGIGWVRALVTTAISQSAIRRDQLTDLLLSQVIPTSDKTVNRTGRKLKVDGHLVSLNVRYKGMETCIENFRVASEMDPPSVLILGMDWINQTRVKIQSEVSKIKVSKPHKK